jgi:hypothetical protein
MIMYWNNPLTQITWPTEADPFVEHNLTHCLFYNPVAGLDHVVTNQKLADLCEWAMQWLNHDGLAGFAAEPRCHYDIANLVKLNMWLHDIRRQGIVKPWLLQDRGDGTFQAGTGDSRLKCLERMPEIVTVSAFVSTRQDRAHLYADLEPVMTFDQFAQLCGAVPGQQFLFRFTDADAPYGLFWYEYNSELTRAVTPGQDQAVDMFVQYMQQHPGTQITPEWFDQAIEWDRYRSSN